MQSALDIAKSQNAAQVFNVANFYGGKSQALKREIRFLMFARIWWKRCTLKK